MLIGVPGWKVEGGSGVRIWESPGFPGPYQVRGDGKLRYALGLRNTPLDAGGERMFTSFRPICTNGPQD